MIERLYLRELLSFQAVDLSFASGLVVLSGPSGAGKSLLMGSILSAFGIGSTEAKLCEVSIHKPLKCHSDAYMLEDELIVRSLKKDRIRYYLNEQNISKKALQSLLSPYVHYLSVRDRGGFENETLIGMLDAALICSDKSYKKLYKEYHTRYQNYRDKQTELAQIQERERKLSELIEFTTFEINKIKTINPKVGEDDTLLQLKKQLSRMDKINDALEKSEAIFGLETQVSEVFRLMDKDGEYFSDAMNQLRADFEETQVLAEELGDTDVEDILNRLEQITALTNRHGSIEEAILYCESKEQELAGYERIEQDKSILESFLELEFVELTTLAKRMTQRREKQAKEIAQKLGVYLTRLKLSEVSFVFETVSLYDSGADRIDMQLSHSTTATLSGGEHNRLRLALMVVALEMRSHTEGVIILDEIDANVSGDESIAIAEMIAKLSEAYQIFAISHQPHLAAKANQHILIDREDGESRATHLDHSGRIKEIARIIGGEIAGEEAIAFANQLLETS